MYVDNNALRYNCDELVEQFEASIAADACIQLHRDGNLEWGLSVRYAFEMTADAIGCNPTPAHLEVVTQVLRYQWGKQPYYRPAKGQLIH